MSAQPPDLALVTDRIRQVALGPPVAVRIGVANRRRHARRAFFEPVNICTDTRKDRAGISHDVSPNGIMFHSRSRFMIGERVDLTFRISSVELKYVSGRVVRASAAPSYDSTFPYEAAVEFDAPHSDLGA